MRFIYRVNICLGIILLLLGCSPQSDQKDNCDSGSVDGDTDADTDSDTDSDTDADSDSDTDSSTIDQASSSCKDFPSPNAQDGCKRILLSKSSDGKACHGQYPVISADGSTVAFLSRRPNDGESPCLTEDNNDENDIYIADLKSGTLKLVATQPDGNALVKGTGDNALLSANGNIVVFSAKDPSLATTQNYQNGIFALDRKTTDIELISVSTAGKAASSVGQGLAISPNGQFVVFDSSDSTLVDNDSNDFTRDIFIRDRSKKTTERITLKSKGLEVQENSYHIAPNVLLSNDGRFVAFIAREAFSSQDVDSSLFSNFEKNDLYLRDRQTDETRLITIAPNEYSRHGVSMFAIAPDGSWIIFHVYKGAKNYIPDNPTFFIKANIKPTQITFEPFIYEGLKSNKKNVLEYALFSGDLKHIMFASNDADLVGGSMGYFTSNHKYWGNVVDYNSKNKKYNLINAAQNGTPGIVPGSLPGEGLSWPIENQDINYNGERIVFSNVQYGIVDPQKYGIFCDDTTGSPVYPLINRVYLRDCIDTP